MESSSPRGRVFLLEALERDPGLASAEGLRQLDECLDCRACEEVCPAHVPVGHMVDDFRREHPNWLHPDGPSLDAHRLGQLMQSPSRLWWFQRMARLGRHARFMRWAKRLPGLASPGLTALSQGLPQRVPTRLSRRRWRRAPSSAGPALFVGCIMDAIYAETNHRTADLIADSGATVAVPASQRCCGAIQYHEGDGETARRLAAANIEAFAQADTVVVNAAGCGAFMKEYGTIFDENSPLQLRAQAFSRRVLDIHEYLDAHPLPAIESEAGRNLPLTIHDACHLAHAQGIRQPLRDLLQRAGYQVVEMVESDRCCGSAGTYNLTHPAMAERLKWRKVDDVPESIVGVATGNPGCILQIQAGLVERGRHVAVRHTVDWVWEAYHHG